MTIKNLKLNAHLIARQKWYQWRQSLVSQILPGVQALLQNLKEDEKRIAELRESVKTSLPTLQERHAALKLELAAEQAAVAEIMACDQDELESLKAAVVEQS